MANESTLTLRTVARELGAFLNPDRPRTADVKLLGLLRSGQIKAGFDFPGLVTRWISIPEPYWMRISSDEFARIRRSDARAYKVRLSLFAAEYLEVIEHDEGGAPSKQGLNELKAALKTASHQYEVVIRERDWNEYKERYSISASPQTKRRDRRGTREKTSWGHLLPIVAGYLMMLVGKNKHQDYEAVAEMVLQLARNEGIEDLPLADTIADKVASAYAWESKSPVPPEPKARG
jgi:hypothetical protein